MLGPENRGSSRSLPHLPQEENWSIFGRIMGELQRRSGPSLRGLEGREQDDGGFLCGFGGPSGSLGVVEVAGGSAEGS